jgi:hypothetical protein
MQQFERQYWKIYFSVNVVLWIMVLGIITWRLTPSEILRRHFKEIGREGRDWINLVHDINH